MKIDPTHPFQLVLIPPLIQSSALLRLRKHDRSDGLRKRTRIDIAAAFTRGPGHGVLHLGAVEINTALPAEFSFYRDLGRTFVAALCSLPELRHDRSVKEIPLPAAPDDLPRRVQSAPPMPGAEYIDSAHLRDLWTAIGEALRTQLAESGQSLQAFLADKNPIWNLVGRVCLHLAENRKDAEHPFAFMATYTTQPVSERGGDAPDATKALRNGKSRGRGKGRDRVRHQPLSHALQQTAASGDNRALLSLLDPIHRAAGTSTLMAELYKSGELFRATAWSSERALQFLRETPTLEAAGVLVRVPDWWKKRQSSRLAVSVTVGQSEPGALGLDAMLDFSMAVTLDGTALSKAEVKRILANDEALLQIRGQWVELDRERLASVLDYWKTVERAVDRDGLSFHDAMRLLASQRTRLDSDKRPDSVADDDDEPVDIRAQWSDIRAGDWMSSVLKGLRQPDTNDKLKLGRAFRGTLRPYQDTGVSWLHFASSLGLGVCLADDMGLGKTLQVLALLVRLKSEQRRKRGRDRKTSRQPATKQPTKQPTNGTLGALPTKLAHLIVAPASLLANWHAESERFTPGLNILVAHPSFVPVAKLNQLDGPPKRTDVVITSYGMLHRLSWLKHTRWHLVILDEAQAIKNPNTRQTRAAKTLRAHSRIALTGTPIENRLSDLWSLFDFLSPGMLGSAKAFSRYAKELAKRADYTPLRRLVRPYILRRLKTDRAIITELPDKIEVYAYCGLSKRQAAIYQATVDKLAKTLSNTDSGMARRGLVLSYLLRFKQVCNHPSQRLGDGVYATEDSGKFGRLIEIARAIADKGEKLLVFTQFREMIAPLNDLLENVFERPGVTLDGTTPVRRRKSLVERFQSDPDVPYFVLSIKAGGTGLTLTAATHVVHFDRWWNPAVEDQATDRAFRIGQKNNVLVHKFVCRGTIEEKIDAMISDKRALSQELLGGNSEIKLTELSDDELLDLVTLDLTRATC